MSPATMQSRLCNASNTLRWEQPGQSCGGFPGTGDGSGEVSPARIRRTRATLSSPNRYISGWLSTFTPAARIASARYGSPSSITRQRFTPAANARIFSSGRGWVIPSFRKDARGAASQAWRYATPEAMMPRVVSPGRSRLSGDDSFHWLISANFLRSRRCAGFALDGIITRLLTSRSNRGVGGGEIVLVGRTTDLEWHTRVVIRNNTGKCQRSEISTAASVKSYASCASDGSIIGTPAATA